MTRCIAIFLTSVLLFHLPALVLAQTNSWTNATSGNWADPYWSLGVLPTTNEDIMLTNEGWKAVAIDPNTAQDFPETMTVSSITISSPSNSYNTLLLNYSGTETPLTTQYIVLGSNSAITMLSSALELDGPNGTMELGGEFNQTNSIVNANQIDVGSIGPAVYNMDSGILNVSKLWVRGGFNGVFNQSGGTNNAGIAGFYAGGAYNLSGGDFNSTVYFNNGVFHQTGGSIDQPLTNNGTYLFDGGINYGGVVGGNVTQTGGTNFGGLDFSAGGGCVLSNGCSFIPDLNLGINVTFQQSGGTQIITNGLSLVGGGINYAWGRTVPGGVYSLSGGTLMTGGMDIKYLYYQNGGTNIVTGGIEITNFEPVIFAGLELNDGLLQADSLTTTFGGIVQLTGGCLMVNNLSAYGNFDEMTLSGPDIQCLGGELIVSNIDVEWDNFAISGTIVKQTGTFTLGQTSSLLPGPGTYTFGPLSPDGPLVLPTNVDCQIHFGDSSSQPWSVLIIKNWSGSIYGGGSQQIFFGSNSAALTSNELSQIEFFSPAGLPPSSLPAGIYLARILPTGEIVPDTGAPLPLKMQIGGSLSNGVMPLTIEGGIGQNYEVDVSTDLVDWSNWMDVSNPTGTISLSDCGVTNFPQRFYRVRVLP